MKKLFLGFSALFLTITLFHSCNEPLVNDQTADEVELKSASNAKKSYIVVLNDDDLNLELANLKGYERKQQAVQAASARILKHAGISDGTVEHVYGTAIKGFSVMIPPGQLKKLQDDPSVKYVEEDQIATLIYPSKKPDNPGGGKPGGGNNGGGGSSKQETPWGIKRVNGASTYTGSGVAWIIDTGIDVSHPDLHVDASRGALYARGKSVNDDNGHGTHVAGTIAAINNNIGVIGVAPGATVIPVKVLDRRGSGYYSDVIAGVNYVASNGQNGDVANMSLGGPVSDALDQAVKNAAGAGIKFALAAGNESDDANNHSPARVNGNNIYTISAMDSGDNWAYFSNYNNPPIDYCEPGVNIKSTWKDGGYNTISGTSMASPHAAGLLLLGNISNGGTVQGDPDGNPDPIGIH